MVIDVEENKNTPEIRFKGFNDAWEQRKLDELGVSTSGTSIESEFEEGEKYIRGNQSLEETLKEIRNQLAIYMSE